MFQNIFSCFGVCSKVVLGIQNTYDVVRIFPIDRVISMTAVKNNSFPCILNCLRNLEKVRQFDVCKSDSALVSLKSKTF